MNRRRGYSAGCSIDGEHAMYGYGYENGPWMHGSWMFGGGLMMFIWIVLIALAVAVVVSLFRRSGPNIVGKSALDILKERYARGEIDKEEFEVKKRDLAD